MQYVLIVNPVAGNGFALNVLEKAEAVLQDREFEYTVVRTEHPRHATALARKASADENVRAVFSVGGDGTAGEVAAGLAGTGKAMGIIPAGTGNDFIKALHLPKDPIKALDFLLSHDAAPVDTGTVNGEFFLNVCGTGFDVTVLDYAEKNKAKTRGLTPYFLGLLEAIFHYRPLRLTVTRDGKRETIDALICSVANGQYIGGGIPICPSADPTDGLIDLVMIKGIPRWRIPFYLPGLMMSGALRFRITRHETVQKVLVEGNGLRVNIDGDIRSMEKAEFAVHPGSLMLIH